MNAQEFRQEVDFDLSLQVGSKVKAHWTNSHRYFSVPAEVIKVNEKSLLVKILEETGSGVMVYHIGHKIHLPRLINLKVWSANNRAYPLTEGN